MHGLVQLIIAICHFIKYEKMMIQKAKLKMPELFGNDIYPIQSLIKLQHYGLPTRLLDFTTNSLVALYFACQRKTVNQERKDGKVLICFIDELKIYNCFSPFINAIAHMNTISEFSESSCDQFIELLSNTIYWKFAASTYCELTTEKIMERISYPIFFEPEYNSERIKRQQGLFLIFPNEYEKLNKKLVFTDAITEWEPNQSMEIEIPDRHKAKILSDLIDLGITKSFLFPEPEKICSDIVDTVKSRFVAGT